MKTTRCCTLLGHSRVFSRFSRFWTAQALLPSMRKVLTMTVMRVKTSSKKGKSQDTTSPTQRTHLRYGMAFPVLLLAELMNHLCRSSHQSSKSCSIVLLLTGEPVTRLDLRCVATQGGTMYVLLRCGRGSGHGDFCSPSLFVQVSAMMTPLSTMSSLDAVGVRRSRSTSSPSRSKSRSPSPIDLSLSRGEWVLLRLES